MRKSSVKGFLLAAVARIAGVTSATATPITWYIGGSGGNTAGFALSDGSTITGSFTYDADISTPNCASPGPSCIVDPNNAAGGPATYGGGVNAQPADYNGYYGLFGTGVSGGNQTGTAGGVTGSFAVNSASALNGVPTGQTWWINTNAFDTQGTDMTAQTDCCADSTDFWLVDANPATTKDLTGYYGIQIFLSTPMTDAGNLYPTGDVVTGVLGGICSDYACGNDFISPNNVTLADAAANVNTGNVPVTNPGSTPEPSTFLLGASALAVGLWRTKSLARR